MKRSLIWLIEVSALACAVSLAVTRQTRGGRDGGQDPEFTQAAVTAGSVPLTYDAISGVDVLPKPPLPKMGPAGTIIQDPTFGTRILRVTDEHTTELACAGAAAGEQNVWNVDSTLFYIKCTGIVPFRFDRSTMKASPIGRTDPRLSVLAQFGAPREPAFSFSDPDLLYGNGAGARSLSIVQYSFKTQTYSDLFDLSRAIPGLSGYVGTTSVSADEKICMVFDGPQQDAFRSVIVFDKRAGTYHLLNTATSEMDGKPANIHLGFTIHAAGIDKGGRYVFVTPGVEGFVPHVWDTVTGQVAPVESYNGHHACGYGYQIGQNGRWFIRRQLDLDSIESSVVQLILPLLKPEWTLDSHPSWNNAQPDQLVPFVTATYRMPNDPRPWGALDDEIIAVRTDGIESEVWRFAHHRNAIEISDPAHPLAEGNFWNTPRGNVSQDGRFFIFNSNWEGTLGTDPQGFPRQDEFIVELSRANPPSTIGPAAVSQK
jgi:hypothetical protein